MASHFATVSDDDILATNEAAIPTDNNTKFGLAMFTGTRIKKLFSYRIYNKIVKMHSIYPRNTAT